MDIQHDKLRTAIQAVRAMNRETRTLMMGMIAHEEYMAENMDLVGQSAVEPIDFGKTNNVEPMNTPIVEEIPDTREHVEAHKWDSEKFIKSNSDDTNLPPFNLPEPDTKIFRVELYNHWGRKLLTRNLWCGWTQEELANVLKLNMYMLNDEGKKIVLALLPWKTVQKAIDASPDAGREHYDLRAQNFVITEINQYGDDISESTVFDPDKEIE